MKNIEAQPSLQSRPDVLNREHPTLDPLRGVAKVENYQFFGNVAAVKDQLKKAVEIYPEKYRPKFKKDIARYHLTEVTPIQSLEEPSDVGIIFLSGALGNAVGNAHIMGHLYLEGKEKFQGNLGFVVGLSSSASLDTNETAFPQSHAERSGHQAAVIFDYLKAHPTRKLFVLGHSLGGLEASYAVPLLEQLFRMNNIDTTIAGTLLIHPDNLYKQGASSFVKRFIEYNRKFLVHEIAEQYPSLFDLQNVQRKIALASEEADFDQVERLEKQLAEMEENHGDPKNLDQKQRDTLLALDNQIDLISEGDGKFRKRKLKKLHKKRYKLLKPIVREGLSTADARQKRTALKAIWRTFRVTMVRKNERVVDPLPSYVRNTMSGEIAVIWGDNNFLFPADQAIQRMANWSVEQRDRVLKSHPNATDEEIEQASRYFPQATRVHEAIIGNWAHHAPATDAEKHAKIMVDLMQRMLNPEDGDHIYQLTNKKRVYY